MESIGSIISTMINRRHLTEELRTANILLYAKTWLQEQIYESSLACTPSRIQDTTLTIDVNHSTAAVEVLLHAEALLQALSIRFPAVQLTQVKILRRSRSS